MLRSTFRTISITSLVAALCIVPTQATRAQSTAAAAAASREVTVINAGAAPRRALRYQMVKGASETGTMRQKLNMTMEMGGMEMPPQSLPTTVMTVRYIVSDVTADGTAAIAVEFVNVDIDAEGADPMIVEAMRPQLTGMTGLKSSYTMSATGQVSNMKFDENAPAAMQSMQSTTEQVSVAFPAEPVGVGARWKALRPITQSGMTIMQDVEYVLTSLAADSMVLEVVLAQSAKDQVMDAAAMPPGASATLRSMEGKGTSTMVVRFGSVQPAMDMKMDVKMTIDLNMGGEVNTMNQSMTMEIKTAPVAKP